MTNKSISNFYSIHGILTIQSNTSIPVPDRFRVPESNVQSPDLIIEEGSVDIRLNKSEMTRSGMFFFGKTEEALIIDYMFPVVDAVLELSNLKGRTCLRYTPSFKRFGNIHVLFTTLLQFKLIQQGHTFIHSGCVRSKDSCKLVAGMRNTGKTSTILSLTDGEETKFMSDDLTIIDSSGEAYCYPTTVEISPFTMTGDVLTYDGGRLQRWFARKQIASLIIQDYFGHELSEQKEVPDWAIAERGEINQVFILDGNGMTYCEQISISEAANRILMATTELIDPFRIYSLNFFSFYLDYSIADLFTQGTEIISQALDSTSCFKLNAPDVAEYPSTIKQMY